VAVALTAMVAGLLPWAVVTVIGAVPAVAAPAGAGYVQGAEFGTGSKVASTTAQLTGAVTAGDLLVGWFSQYDAAGTVQVSDNVNGPWTRGSASTPFGSTGDNALFYVAGSKASAAGLTVTVSGATATYLQGAFAEYSGVTAGVGPDAAVAASGTGTAVNTGASAAVPAGDLVYSALVTGGSPTSVTPGSSAGLAYTARATSGSGSVYEQDILSGAAGAQTGTATFASSTDWHAVVAAFRPASAPPPPTPQPPAAPTGLASTSDTSTQVGLTWTASTDNVPVTGYTIYRNGTSVGTSPTTSFSDAGVAPSTSYSYTVRATNNAGQVSVPSTPLSVTTPAAPPPCSIAALAAWVAAANGGAGGGVVNLQPGCVYTIANADNATDGGNGLPVITGSVTVHGNGATITRSTASGVPHVRIFDVASGASLTLDSVTLSNGIADNGHDGGGAIDNRGTLSVSGSTFTGNSNPATSGTSGGAIQNAGTMTLTTSTFTGNVAMEGGAVFNQNIATITRSTFSNNTATVYGGGAIVNAYGTTTVDGSTFVGNTGPGGGVIDNDTTIHISDSTMVGNTAGNHGGGAIINFGTATVTTSTLSGNSSPYGSDIYNYGSSSLTVSSSIVANGTGSANCGGTAIADGGYNLDTATSCHFATAKHSKNNTNPQLQPLASNGGPTQTMALTPGSPAIDAIPPATTGCAGTTDQRGTARPQGAGCDIGAYELVVTTARDTQPPTTPTGLTAQSSTARDVVLSWNASTDDVGVTGYTVYRNGTAIGTSSGASPGYTDTTAASSSTYGYTVDAFDAAGNHSAQSAPLSVTTTTPPPVTAHWVQGGAAGSGSAVTSIAITLTSPVAAGDALLGWFGQYNSPGQVQVSDNVNGAWTRGSASTTFSNGGGDIALFSVRSSVAAPAGITITITASAATYLQGTAADYSGLSAANPIDTAAVATGTSAAADSGATGAAAAGELVYSGLMTGASPGTATPTGGLVARENTGGYCADDADRTVTTAGAQHGTWTLQNSADWYDVAVVLHTAAGP
jgi:chitodextrinase